MFVAAGLQKDPQWWCGSWELGSGSALKLFWKWGHAGMGEGELLNMGCRGTIGVVEKVFNDMKSTEDLRKIEEKRI